MLFFFFFRHCDWPTFPQRRIHRWLKQCTTPSTLWCNRCRSPLVHMGSKLSLSLRHHARPFPARQDGREKKPNNNHASVTSSITAAVRLFDFFSLPPHLCFLPARRSTQIKTYSWDNAQVVLAGNKCDMEEERVVSVDSGRLLAEQLGESGHHSSTPGVSHRTCSNLKT